MKLSLLLLPFLLCCSLSSLNAQNVVSQRDFGGADDDYVAGMQPTFDGGLVVGGISKSGKTGVKSDSARGGFDFLIVKLSRSGPVQWQKTIGSAGDDYLTAIQQTVDSGYVLGGYTIGDSSADMTGRNHGGADTWVVKLDATGAIQWQRLLGGSNDDGLFDLRQTYDGGYICVSSSASDSSGDKSTKGRGNTDYWVVKLSSTGAIQWQRTLGGSGYDDPSSVRQTSDSGYIVFGTSDSSASGDKTLPSKGGADLWIVKLSKTGGIEWQKVIGGQGNDYTANMTLTADGGFLFCGNSDSPVSGDKSAGVYGAFDIWLVKTDASGNIKWDKTIGGSNDDRSNDIRRTSEGGYVVGALSNSDISGDKTEKSRGNYDFWLINLDSTGKIRWQKTVGGDNAESLSAAFETIDKNYALSGFTRSGISGDKLEGNYGASDFWIVRVSAPSNSVATEEAESTVSVLPNPFTDHLDITTEHPEHLVLCDMFGRIVRVGNVGMHRWDVSELPAGTYWVTDRSSGKQMGLVKVK